MCGGGWWVVVGAEMGRKSDRPRARQELIHWFAPVQSVAAQQQPDASVADVPVPPPDSPGTLSSQGEDGGLS